MRALTTLRKKETTHCIAVPVGARIARPLFEFVRNSGFVKNRIKQIEKRMSICYDVHIHFIGCV